MSESSSSSSTPLAATRAVATPRPFRIGDRVRVLGPFYECGGSIDRLRLRESSPRVGVIERRDPSGETEEIRRACWRVVTVEGDEWDWGYYADDELELVEAAPEGEG